jgi:hypothetical protein
MDPKKVAAILD